MNVEFLADKNIMYPKRSFTTLINQSRNMEMLLYVILFIIHVYISPLNTQNQALGIKIQQSNTAWFIFSEDGIVFLYLELDLQI